MRQFYISLFYMTKLVMPILDNLMKIKTRQDNSRWDTKKTCLYKKILGKTILAKTILYNCRKDFSG